MHIYNAYIHITQNHKNKNPDVNDHRSGSSNLLVALR